MAKEKQVKSKSDEIAGKYHAVTGDQYEDFIDQLPVYSTGIPDLDMAFGPIDPIEGNGGLRARDMLEVLGQAGMGKSQPLDAKLRTPTGWVTMGEIKVGDLVIGSDGKPTEVIGVYPQGVRPIYKVTFQDGASTECDEQHLWAVYLKSVNKNRQEDLRIYSTKQLIDCNARNISGDRIYRIPVTLPVEGEDLYDRDFDPYLIGLLIGDGSFAGSALRYTTADKELKERISEILDPLSLELSDADKKGISYNIRCKNESERVKGKNRLRNEIQRLGLSGHKSGTKFVPDVYKFSSIEARKAMLAGLLDTDGTIARGGEVSFCSKSKQLADDCIDIVQSLGGKASLGKPKVIKNTPYYRVYIAVTFNPFRLSRKALRWRMPKKYFPQRIFDSIEFVGEKEAQCIRVKAANSLYLTDNYIVTHNTALMHSFIRATQKRFPGQKCIAALFSEPPDIPRMKREGIDPSLIYILGVNTGDVEDKKILAEYALDGLVEFAAQDDIKLCVIDSIGALFTENQEERSVLDSEAVADLAKVMNKFVVRFMKRSKSSALIMTNHYSEPISTGFGFTAPPSVLNVGGPGGKGRKFHSKIRITASATPKWREKGTEKVKHPVTGGLIQDGLNIKYVVFRNKYANSDSYRTVTVTLDFHRNAFNTEEGLIEKAIFFSYTDEATGEKKSTLNPPVFQGGSWITVGDQKFQGTSKAAQYLIDNPSVYDALYKQVLAKSHVFFGNQKVTDNLDDL